MDVQAVHFGISPFISSATLEQKVFMGKVRNLLKYGRLYLNEIGAYMVMCDDFTIIDTIESEKMIYPHEKYTDVDIKVTSWDGGTHFYARIAGI